jgi:hypothetical protein
MRDPKSHAQRSTTALNGFAQLGGATSRPAARLRIHDMRFHAQAAPPDEP